MRCLHLTGKGVDAAGLSRLCCNMQHNGIINTPPAHGLERAGLGSVRMIGDVVRDFGQMRQRARGERIGEDMRVKVNDHKQSGLSRNKFINKRRTGGNTVHTDPAVSNLTADEQQKPEQSVL